MSKKGLILISLPMMAVLVVVVTGISRMIGGVVAVVLPPLVVFGVAIVLGNLIKKRGGG